MTIILLVEDNVSLLDAIRLELEMNDYSVVGATDGQAALDALQYMDPPPDIIISDLIMPNMDGFEFLDTVRTRDQWAEIPFIFLTARDSLQSIRTSKELGVDDYLMKPFNPTDLLLTVENRLKRIRQVRKGANKQLDKTRHELLKMVSHEFRTPLSALYGGTELLAQSLVDAPDESIHKLLNLVHAGTRRLHRVVDNIVMMVQIDSGHLEDMLPQIARHYKITKIVQTVIELLQNEDPFNNKGIELVLNQPYRDVCVTGIHEHLYMMVTELLRNAFVFSPAGGTINVDIVIENTHVVIQVSDEGPGIEPEELEIVWERFQQIKRDKYEQQGVGLGLPLARASARIHGGDCELESSPSGGLTAILTLPISDKSDCE